MQWQHGAGICLKTTCVVFVGTHMTAPAPNANIQAMSVPCVRHPPWHLFLFYVQRDRELEAK